ncbi:MAG: hypothetical protein A2X59_08005 [Nitrospirae bacterium GWC2_42_7]|nr:MAG: hypothetical protein A2X59_08005 [Nitrospirae bacterium GWC2_42_7]
MKYYKDVAMLQNCKLFFLESMKYCITKFLQEDSLEISSFQKTDNNISYYWRKLLENRGKFD